MSDCHPIQVSTHSQQVKNSNKMILVTGFGPYKEASNASGVLVESLARELPDELVSLRDDLAFEVINCDTTSRETEHRTLETQLAALLQRYQPDICIHTGQAPPYNRITIEKVAINTFMREIIDPARPVGYWSNLPGTEDLQSVLSENAIPAGDSFYCGQHLCNHILYSSLHFAATGPRRHKAGFIHVPLLPEQVVHEHRNAPHMPLGMARQALSIVIRQVTAAYESKQQQPVTRQR